MRRKSWWRRVLEGTPDRGDWRVLHGSGTYEEVEAVRVSEKIVAVTYQYGHTWVDFRSGRVEWQPKRGGDTFTKLVERPVTPEEARPNA